MPKTDQVAPKKTGRPSKYTPELAAEICERLSNGEPLRQICRDAHMPAWTAIYAWAAKDAVLSERIAHARNQGYEAIAEECLLIADNPEWGLTESVGPNGQTVTKQDMLGHRKLRIETRLKLLAKWDPKRYGDRLALAGDEKNPIHLEANVKAEQFFEELLINLELSKAVGD
jgi:hypothetical protein